MSVALRFRLDVCVPHQCKCDKALVDSSGIYGLSCHLSAGRLPRHFEFNDIFKSALSSAYIPSRLETIGLDYKSKKRSWANFILGCNMHGYFGPTTHKPFK